MTDPNALLRDMVEALKASIEYVARYESEHMSNKALDVYINANAVLARAEAALGKEG